MMFYFLNLTDEDYIFVFENCVMHLGLMIFKLFVDLEEIMFYLCVDPV